MIVNDKVLDKVLIKALIKNKCNIARALLDVGLPSSKSSYNRCYQLIEGHKLFQFLF